MHSQASALQHCKGWCLLPNEVASDRPAVNAMPSSAIATALLFLLQYFEVGPEEHPEAQAVRLQPPAQQLPQQQELHIAAAPHLPSHSGDDAAADEAAGPTTPDQQAVVSTERGAGQAEAFPGPVHCSLADHQMGPAGSMASGDRGSEEQCQQAQQQGGHQRAGTSRGDPSDDDREESASDSTESFDFEQLTPEEQEQALQEAAKQLAEDKEGGREGSKDSDSFASEGEETGSGKLPSCCLLVLRLGPVRTALEGAQGSGESCSSTALRHDSGALQHLCLLGWSGCFVRPTGSLSNVLVQKVAHALLTRSASSLQGSNRLSSASQETLPCRT